jgi:hypothetical protein
MENTSRVSMAALSNAFEFRQDDGPSHHADGVGREQPFTSCQAKPPMISTTSSNAMACASPERF